MPSRARNSATCAVRQEQYHQQLVMRCPDPPRSFTGGIRAILCLYPAGTSCGTPMTGSWQNRSTAEKAPMQAPKQLLRTLVALVSGCNRVTSCSSGWRQKRAVWKALSLMR